MFNFLSNKIHEKYVSYLVYLLLFLLGFTILYTAWVVEDAFITFRTVDNFWQGYGLRWNIDERVMTYTHPLWMLLLVVVRGFTDNLFIGSLFLCFIFTFLTIRYLVVYKKNNFFLVLGLLGLLSSKAFIDYSTSGLENSLVHFLVLTLLVQFLIKNNKNIAVYSCIVGLILLSRLDLIFFVLPICLYVFYFSLKHYGVKSTTGRILLGAMPFIVWNIFATYYYGSFIPNTAWAKLNHGIEHKLLWHQGYLYFQQLYINDFISFSILIFITMSLFLQKDNKLRLLGLSISISLIYIFNIGADYMLGRFISVYVLVGLTLLVFGKIRLNIKLIQAMILWLLLGLVAYFINNYSNLYIGFLNIILILIVFVLINLIKGQYSDKFLKSNILLGGFLVLLLLFTIDGFLIYKNPWLAYDKTGIVNERLVYFPSNNFWQSLTRSPEPHLFYKNGLQLKQGNYPKYIVIVNIGMTAYLGGDKYHVIDPLALADPFLAQFPVEGDWRIGHFPRKIKKEYINSIISGKNLMSNYCDHRLLDDIWLLSRLPLNHVGRLAAIVRLHTGSMHGDMLCSVKQPVSDTELVHYKFLGTWKNAN